MADPTRTPATVVRDILVWTIMVPIRIVWFVVKWTAIGLWSLVVLWWTWIDEKAGILGAIAVSFLLFLFGLSGALKLAAIVAENVSFS